MLRAAHDELVDDPQIDVIAISCNPGDKAHWVEQAAKAGKHVFLNKPMCESLDSARRIVDAVARHGIQLVHDIIVIRFNPVTAKLWTSSGGDYMQASALRPQLGDDVPGRLPARRGLAGAPDPPAAAGGGELTNMGCYAIDYMVALWGRPLSVQAKWRKTWDPYRAADVEIRPDRRPTTATSTPPLRQASRRSGRSRR